MNLKRKQEAKLNFKETSSIQLINDEIEKVTLEIETNHPELYILLDETPYKTNVWGKVITETDLEDYLKSLKAQLETFQKNEPLK